MTSGMARCVALAVLSLAAGASTLRLTEDSPSYLHESTGRRINVMSAVDARVTACEGTDSAGHRYRVRPERLPLLRAGVTASIDVLTLREGHGFTFRVEAAASASAAAGAGAATSSATVAFSTPAVSTGAGYRPEVYVDLPSQPNKMAEGWTWWSNFPGGNNSAGTLSRFLDSNGTTRYALSCRTLFEGWFPTILNNSVVPKPLCGITGVQIKLRSGNLLINWATNYAIVSGTGLSGLAEVAPGGKVLHTWVGAILPPQAAAQKIFYPPEVIKIDVQDINHDVQELPNGNWMFIAYKVVLVTTAQCPNWRSIPKLKNGANVTGDELVEFEPYSAKIVKRWSVFDALDVCSTYPGRGAWPSPEWIHMNAFDVHNVFDVQRNELIVSSFSLGWVFAMRYADDAHGKAGSLMWILGRARPNSTAGPKEAEFLAAHPHYELKLRPGMVPADRMQAGQHNANIIDARGNVLLMFANEAMTGGKMDQGTPSRLLMYNITKRPTLDGKTNGECEIMWEQQNNGTSHPGYNEGLGRSPFLGGAKMLANGNILGQFGALTQPSCNAPCERNLDVTCMYSRVVEYTPSKELVFAVHVGGRVDTTARGEQCYGWNGYRAARYSPAEVKNMLGGHMDLSDEKW